MLVTIPPAWEYSNSSEFCGTTCHTMPPNFVTYQESPHARVSCVDCHIGRDLIIVQATRKIGHVRLVIDTLLDEIEYPILVSDMQPARQTCERCHSPEKFSDDSLRVLHRVENNRENELVNIYMLMHTGGGANREGLGRGIHWHIENKVTFIATDKLEQEIPWVRVESEDGTVDYNAINSPIDTENLDQYEMQEMDCTTCHNRIAHQIDSPDIIVDNAIFAGDLSPEIPFIRVRAVELLSEKHQSLEEAQASFDSLHSYYSANYPEFYENNKELVDQAVVLLGTLWGKLYYPEQYLDWQTHPNNTGHKESPGCFRCHDGQHFTTGGEVIRLECNLCHSIPTVVHADDIEPKIPLATGIEPTSHLDSTWIARHHNAFDATCSNCHDTSNPGGADDSSFCSNSACHGSAWDFAGFNAPGLSSILRIYQYEPEPLLEDFDGEPTYTILQPLFEQKCGACHGAKPVKNLRLIDYAGAMQGSDSGPVIIAGSPDDSKIIHVLEDGHFARLSEHQMQLLREWIANGAIE
jgi:nitrate/TMAO reductase-like tetraheme cytochrome c subunit